MKRRILSMILVATLILTCCSFVAQAEEEPIKATAVVFGSSGFIPTTDNYGTNYIKEHFGLDLEVLPVDTATDESWNIFWGGDGYADIVLPYGTAQAKQLVKEELVRPIDYEMIKEYAPRLHTLLMMVYGTDEEAIKQLKVNGEVYCIPYFATTNGLSWVSAIRKDWLANVGLDVPTTVEELGEVLRAFTEDDPDGNGINDTYGCNSIQYGLFNLATSFGTSEAFALWMNDEGTEITTNVISEEYRNFLRQVHEWYAAGYIDPEFVTDVGDRAATRSKWANGKMGIYCDNPWWFEMGRGETGPLQMLIDTDGTVGWDNFAIFAGLPDAEGNTYVNSLYGAINGQASIYFGYDCPDEIVIKCLEMTNARVRLYDGTEEDYAAARIRAEMDSGIEGLDWEWDEEAMAPVKLRDNDAQYSCDNGLYIFPTAAASDMTKFIGKEDEFVIEAYDMALSPNKIYRSNNFNTPTLEGVAADKYDIVTSYFSTCKVDFITGAMSLEDDWDTYVQEMLNKGLEDVLAAYLEAANA